MRKFGAAGLASGFVIGVAALGLAPLDAQAQLRVGLQGMYTSGWIKRGPSGVIGTNKKDGTETAGAMLEDAGSSAVLDPANPDPSALEALVRERQPHVVDYEDWSRLDALELSRGEAGGRPRVKFTSRAEMRAALKDS